MSASGSEPGTTFVDDTDTSLIWEGEWKQQSGADDPIAKVSFRGSYHATETNGSMLTFRTFQSAFTFPFIMRNTLLEASQGDVVTVYGSRGPGHANYTVTVVAKSTIFKYSAFAKEFQPMQNLWSDSFTADSVIHIQSNVIGDNTWLDFDYITFHNTM
jgi:hypothetical protein